MLKAVVLAILNLFLISNLYAAQSTIIESEGYACMGEDKSRRQAGQDAAADAKRKAIELVSTYMQSETQVKNFELQKDLISVYANANVRILQEIEKEWHKDAAMGDCYRIRIKAEVIPDEKEMERAGMGKQKADDPSAPLNVRVWMDKSEYKNGEKMKVY